MPVQRVVGAFLTQVPVGDLPKRVVEVRHQAVQRVSVAGAIGDEQLGDFFRNVGSHRLATC